MKWVITLWASPLALFWGWYFISLNDVHFGYVMLTRRAHDLVFQLYGEMLGIDPTTIPALIAEACVLDSAILAAIFALRRRRAILGWLRDLRARYVSEDAAPSA